MYKTNSEQETNTVKNNVKIVAVDLQKMAPLDGVIQIQGNTFYKKLQAFFNLQISIKHIIKGDITKYETANQIVR